MEKQQIVCNTGDQDQEFYVILKGKVRVLILKN